MTTTSHKQITVILSDRRPVLIYHDEWTTVARANDHDGASVYEANRIDTVRVREHADGRRIIDASHKAGNGGMPANEREIHAGYLIAAVSGDMHEPAGGGPLVSTHPDDEATIQAIRRVAGAIGRDDLGAECIGDLPAEKI